MMRAMSGQADIPVVSLAAMQAGDATGIQKAARAFGDALEEIGFVTIVDHVEDPTFLGREISEIATSHQGYGVTDEMYAWVGDALIDSLREGCGPLFTAEAEASWRAAYGAIAKTILATGARR